MAAEIAVEPLPGGDPARDRAAVERARALEIDAGALGYIFAPALDRVERAPDPGRFIAHLGPISAETQAFAFTWRA